MREHSSQLSILVAISLSLFACGRTSDEPVDGNKSPTPDSPGIQTPVPSKVSGEEAAEMKAQRQNPSSATSSSQTTLPTCSFWVTASHRHLEHIEHLMDKALPKFRGRQAEFGPYPPVFSCCKKIPPGEDLGDANMLCDAVEYVKDQNGWDEIGFSLAEASALSFFGTLDSKSFKASASADLTCDGEPEFKVTRVVPRRPDGSLDHAVATWEYSAWAEYCSEPE